MNMNVISNKLFDYLGLEPIDIKYEDLGIEDSRFYTRDLYISINNKYKDNDIELLKCLIHEIRHYYQLICVALNFDLEPQTKIWKEEFKMNRKNMEPGEDMCLLIEVDAYAFTKYILKKWFDYDYHHHDSNYDMVLDELINKLYYY